MIEKSLKGKNILTVENETIYLKILPEIGGKILSIKHKESDTEFLKQTNVSLEDLSKPTVSSSFAQYAFGFDDCFPNIAPCKYNFDKSALELPDHGELWNRSWDFKKHNQTLKLSIKGMLLNYEFSKSISLNGNIIKIAYEIKNLENTSFDYLWSAHPLLNINAGDELILPNEIDEVVLNWSSDAELGKAGDLLSWPYLNKNTKTDFSKVQKKSIDFAAKVYSGSLTVGKAGIYKPGINKSLIFSFDTKQVPFLGIWFCYGGWPVKNSLKDFTLGIEPCCGWPDSIEVARIMGNSQQIAPQGTNSWNLTIQIIKGCVSIT